MDRCPNCGATVRVGAKFCTTCGMRLPESAAPAPETNESSRSPFDSTSTVASRWPSRSVYGSSEATQGEPVNNGEVATTAESTEPAAETDAVVSETSAAPEPTEPASTWGAWTAPTAPAADTETEVESVQHSTAEEPSTWGESAATQAEPSEPEGEEAAAASWGRTGETDFLQLPEQPDPAAWKSIESELSGAGTETSGKTESAGVADRDVDTFVVEEIEEGEFDQGGASGDAAAEATQPAPSPSVERGYALLDEMRDILAGLSVQPAPPEPTAAVTSPLEGVKPSDEAVARFAELRAAVDAAQDHPRDIDTMLDLSGRLDSIVELHEAFLNLKDAAFGGSSGPNTDED